MLRKPVNLYYKERKQLKTFLTQTGPAVPLTPDPPVICFWKWIYWKDYEVKKSQFGERFYQKNELFFSPTRCIPTLFTRRAHQLIDWIQELKKKRRCAPARETVSSS
jgi:hypothetical protein